MQSLLIGNYGVGNLGDEALKEYFLTRFPEIEWTVLSADPKGPHEVPRLPFGLRSLVMTPWWRTLGAIRSSDAAVFGGGSLFTDTESVWACVLWWWHAFVARLFRKPVVLAFQGIGPFSSRVGEWCARDVISNAAFVSVRDEESRARVEDWGGGRVVLAFDPVLSLLTAEPEQGNALALIPRANANEEFGRAALEAAMDSSRSVLIISMQPDAPTEQELCRMLKHKIGERAVVHPVRSLQELSRELSACGSVVAARYHGALAALALGKDVQIIPQADGDKLDALQKLMTSPGVGQLRERIRRGEEELRKYMNVL